MWRVVTVLDTADLDEIISQQCDKFLAEKRNRHCIMFLELTLVNQ